jgi:hypothetical protein
MSPAVQDHDLGLLCRLLRAPLDAGSLQGNWPRVLRLVDRHRVGPQLAAAVERFGTPLPEEFRIRLTQFNTQNARRCLAQVADLRSAIAALDAAGIRSIPFKGVVLAQRLYGSPAARAAGDIDLWVPPGHLTDADEVLQAQGLRPVMAHIPLRGPRLPYILRAGHQWSYRTASGHCLELHWRLHEFEKLAPLEFEGVWSRRQNIALGGMTLPSLGADDLYVYLLTHAAREGWSRLSWILDASDCHDEAPEARITAAHRAGVARMNAQMLELRTLDFAQRSRPQPRKQLVRYPEAALLQEQPVEVLRLSPIAYIARYLYLLRLRRDPAYVWDVLATTLARPRMVEVLMYPVRLLPAFWLVRPMSFLLRRRMASALTRNTANPTGTRY